MKYFDGLTDGYMEKEIEVNLVGPFIIPKKIDEKISSWMEKWKNYGSTKSGKIVNDYSYKEWETHILVDIRPTGIKKTKYIRTGDWDSLLYAIRKTKEKFLFVLKLDNAKEKMDLLNETCELCRYFRRRKYKEKCPSFCFYYDRCRARFKDTTFQNIHEINRFALEEVEFNIMLEESVYQRMFDSIYKGE